MRNTLISEINNIFDENTDLKIRNEYLENKISKENTSCKNAEDKSKLTELDKKILEYGKDALRDKVITSGNISVNKLENGTYYCTKFKDWVEDSISTYYLPNSFSKNEIINIFYNELEEKYNKKKAEKINEYEKDHGVEHD